MQQFSKKDSFQEKQEAQRNDDPGLDVKEDKYNITVFGDKFSTDNAPTKSIVIDRKSINSKGLAKYVKSYNIEQASSASPKAHSIWFTSTAPVKDEAYFESGTKKFYSLYLNSVNGKPPVAQDYQNVADLLGVKFNKEIAIDQDKLHQRQKGGLSNTTHQAQKARTDHAFGI